MRARFRIKLLTQYRVSLLRPMYLYIAGCSNLTPGDSTGVRINHKQIKVHTLTHVLLGSRPVYIDYCDRFLINL